MFQQHYLFWLAGTILLVVAIMSGAIALTRVDSPPACSGRFTG